jgi:hypothetical protein
VPDIRALLIAAGVGGGVAAYTILWWHWPLAIGIGAAILLGGLALTSTISVRPAGTNADAAWRAAAPDLQEILAEPAADVPVPRPAPGAEGATPDPDRATRGRGHDLPSGD